MTCSPTCPRHLHDRRSDEACGDLDEATIESLRRDAASLALDEQPVVVRDLAKDVLALVAQYRRLLDSLGSRAGEEVDDAYTAVYASAKADLARVLERTTIPLFFAVSDAAPSERVVLCERPPGDEHDIVLPFHAALLAERIAPREGPDTDEELRRRCDETISLALTGKRPDDLFRSVSPEEFAKLPRQSEEEILRALAEGAPHRSDASPESPAGPPTGANGKERAR